MQSPVKPVDEVDRMDALRALGILDSASEERFDRMARLAKGLFDVPIALVSLVDDDRQWFKSKFGFEASETPRVISFCGHAILQDDVFVVPDASRDGRFSDNPLVTDAPHIRFYAGCPLAAPDGSKLGTLCIIDRKPREFGREDMALLVDLARMAELELSAVQQATMDELTQLSNRRGFESLSQHALDLCRRLQKPAALLFIDLNLFKQINDCHGHAEGDRALTNFAQRLKDTFRDSDVIGRIGGDEFAVLVTDADKEELATSLDRLRSNVDQHNRNLQCGYDLQYSVGAVSFDSKKHTGIAELLADADARMYEQKQKSRQVNHAGEETYQI